MRQPGAVTRAGWPRAHAASGAAMPRGSSASVRGGDPSARLSIPSTRVQSRRRVMRRITFLVGLAVVLNLVLISPALAAPPTNDTFAGRTVIGALAIQRIGRHDRSHNRRRLTPRRTPTAEHRPQTPASGTSSPPPTMPSWSWTRGPRYPVGIIVVTGDPGSFELVDVRAVHRGLRRIRRRDVSDPGLRHQLTDGGTAERWRSRSTRLRRRRKSSLTVDPTGQKTKSGSAIVSGTVTCTGKTSSSRSSTSSSAAGRAHPDQRVWLHRLPVRRGHP